MGLQNVIWSPVIVLLYIHDNDGDDDDDESGCGDGNNSRYAHGNTDMNVDKLLCSSLTHDADPA